MTTHRFEAGKRQQLGQINRAEVGHANVATEAGVDALLHGEPGLLNGHRLARCVDQVQVNVVQLQIPQCFLPGM